MGRLFFFYPTRRTAGFAFVAATLPMMIPGCLLDPNEPCAHLGRNNVYNGRRPSPKQKRYPMRILNSLILLIYLSAAPAGAANPVWLEGKTDQRYSITVYRSATCGCCKGWIDHLEQHNFDVKDVTVDDVALPPLQVADMPGPGEPAPPVVTGLTPVEPWAPVETILAGMPLESSSRPVTDCVAESAAIAREPASGPRTGPPGGRSCAGTARGDPPPPVPVPGTRILRNPLDRTGSWIGQFPQH